ncbi:MAG TPA: hypothetical protein VK968_18590, partial [Roseimicrobium sp.]|nr:hypothetical protein [Roseimicrobium sp.]
KYTFHSSPRIQVAGCVDEYEGGTIKLSITAKNFSKTVLNQIDATTDHASFGGWAKSARAWNQLDET